MATANSGKIWRCEIFGCNDPFFPRGSERHATYAEKRRSHHENVHSQQTTVNWDGSKVAVRRDSHTGLFYCPCRAPKHARRNGRHLRAICRLKTHPPRGKTGGLEDTEDEDEDGDEGDMSGHNGRASGDEDTSYEPDEGDHSEEDVNSRPTPRVVSQRTAPHAVGQYTSSRILGQHAAVVWPQRPR
ncbi:hypothetical protein BD626DRAFT_539734 [Schizophyllum amplum]|uniref:Uncharacterized protein n=1 Tax=Schizophyllum amplum TaxID=97359 RepID=A0A550C2A5_9AGAR|nr:hypothetical protein BD626DRAFT_539734 [Auriculariopsis ampla]